MNPLSLADLLVAARGPLTTAEIARRAAVSIRSIQLWESGRLPARASLVRLMRACRCDSYGRAVIVAAWEGQKAAAHAARRSRA
jgi:transcriptional regulator with XRE-family HTH domain